MLNVGFYNPKTAKVIRQETREGYRITIEGSTVCVCKALVDTGATNSCITKHIADHIKVFPDGEKTVGGANGAYQTKTYSVAMFIQEIGLLIDEMDVFEVKLEENSSEYQALLGMDILSRGHFQLDFSGNFVFCV
ncbi:MAG: retropepsin-like aspartic protease [Candidatus Zeuxoniibacter abyssi]|nr:MAG: retropepsin-like aspartic protease [Candidatus Persebacteraceae bacterium AB1(2)]